ncbi:hypothetical protein C8Q79DRAFT_996631 [Trametes meyenii]|nr:hypothetical protein C8Q79DRAFT_996631 [Trametes meyenii]
MSTVPWDIYAEQMLHLGYGHPLWVPDPAPTAPEVEIGDVGWINDGEFLPLFNVFRGNESQPKGAVPRDHVPLDIKGVDILGPRDKIWQSVLCSRSIRKVDVSASAGMSAVVSPQALACNVRFDFECTDDAGALLFLDPSGRAQDILSRKRIIDYIRTNFDSWLEFANDRLGLGLREEQLLFVSGTTKTRSWGVAAFRGKSRAMRGKVVGNIGSLAAVDFSMTLSDTELSVSHYRAGPAGREDRRADATSNKASDKYDQCIFIHYYKRKRRTLPMFPSVIKAAAGPHDPPRKFEDYDDDNCAIRSHAPSEDSDEIYERFPEQATVDKISDRCRS